MKVSTLAAVCDGNREREQRNLFYFFLINWARCIPSLPHSGPSSDCCIPLFAEPRRQDCSLGPGLEWLCWIVVDAAQVFPDPLVTVSVWFWFWPLPERYDLGGRGTLFWTIVYSLLKKPGFGFTRFVSGCFSLRLITSGENMVPLGTPIIIPVRLSF